MLDPVELAEAGKFFRDKLRPIVRDQLFWQPIDCKHLSQHCHRLGSCCGGHFYHLWSLGMGVHGNEEHSSLELTCKIKVPMVWQATARGAMV